MTNKVFTRMGDGERLLMEVSEIRDDIQEGTEDAAQRANVPGLSREDQERLLAIMTDPSRSVSVAPGNEVVVTDDGGTMSFYSGQDGGGIGVSMGRMQAVLTYERACGADTTSLGHSDYSYKPVKPIINFEMNEYYNISQQSTAPFFYGAQPNLGLYYRPDGPCDNPSEFMALGKIDEARQTQMEAADHLREDLVFVASNLAEVGCEGINFDTSGSAGDADLLAALQAVRQIKGKLPDLPVMLGCSGEFVLGMHGGAEFEGTRLAGLYPQDQVKVVQAAGADIFGLAVSTNSSRSVPWNLARAVTFTRAAVQEGRIPVHVNVGMGVGGVPMLEQPPVDMVSRVAKSLVELGKADGL
ncbi:MAG: hypothetical protein K9K64_09265 [Desulfohalobiaceae bacterium]|nr:hypothetical protein [Desulfohalobiaceae bacterium]